MPEKNNQNQNTNSAELYNSIADMSFLPKKAKDPNLGREFPLMLKAQSIYRLVFLCLMSASVITWLVLLFVYGTSEDAVAFPVTSSAGGYGWFGVIVTALFGLVFLAQQVYSYYYDTKLTRTEDKKKNKTYKLIDTILYYLVFVFVYAAYCTTSLRPAVLYNTDQTSALQWTGLILFLAVLLVAGIGIALNAVKEDAGKVYNYVVLFLAPYLIFCFASVLSHSYSLTNAGITLLVPSAILIDVATIFLILQKHVGYRSTFQTIYSLAMVFQFVDILYYGMVTAASVGAIA